MRIGIVTQPLTTNYGGILQNYALQQVLKKLGHEVWTFDILKYTWWNWLKETCKVVIFRILGRKYPFLPSPIEYAKKQNPLRQFVNKRISLTKPRVYWFERGIIKKYRLNGIVVGSDQVWRPIYNAHIEDMFLAFARGMNLIRIAYAASFGVDKWEFTSQQQLKCVELAKRFNAISVREDSGIALCDKYLGVNATHVLDPTLLLTAENYIALCTNIEEQEPFIFAYILDESEAKLSEIKRFATLKKLPYLEISAGPNVKEDDSIERWLSYFRDAAYVITDSFHGTAFSINFGKDFFVFDNQGRGNSRIDSLLGKLDLKSRIVVDSISMLDPVDWEHVNHMLKVERMHSKMWLKNALTMKSI
jgi:hypothetical protein